MRALVDLGLTAEETKRLRGIAAAEWEGDLARLCRYVLTDYEPAEVFDREVWTP